MRTPRCFIAVAEVHPEPFAYDHDAAWHDFWDDVADAISEYDPWFMVGWRPDLDEYVIDVLPGWDVKMRRLNVRQVQLFRPFAGKDTP